MESVPAVILARPTEEGNVGAVARAMANTGLERLILVEPAVSIGERARARAVGAADVLDNARRASTLEEAVAPFRRIIGTSSHRARLPRARFIAPRELPRSLASPASSTALLFGPERSGLTIEELSLCGAVVRIPTASRQPTLNLAQAVLVLSYELFLARSSDTPDDSLSTEASTAAVSELHAHVDSVLHRIGFARDSTYPGVLRDLRRLGGRARLTEREVRILRGLCRRLENALADPTEPTGG